MGRGVVVFVVSALVVAATATTQTACIGDLMCGSMCGRSTSSSTKPDCYDLDEDACKGRSDCTWERNCN